MQQPFLIFRFERFSAQKGEPGDIIVTESGKNFFFGLFGKFSAVGTVPGFPVESVFAVMPASSD